MLIPELLRRADLLFVLIPPGEKGPRSDGWNIVSNGLPFNSPELSRHIGLSGNYGFYPAPGSSVLPLDIDDSQVFKEAGGEDLVAGAYCYSAHADRSKYRALVLCHDIPDYWKGRKAVIKKHGSSSSVLEIFFPAGPRTVFIEETRAGEKIRIKTTVLKTGGQVVGPYSIHPNGNMYEPFDDKAPLKTVKWSDIMKVCDNIRPNSLEEHEPKNAHISREYAAPGRKLLRDRYNLSLWDYLPEDHYPSGNEIRGKNQFHGSTNERGNVSVNMEKNSYYCFRHQHGYDAAGLDAISRGIIECGQDYDGIAFKKHVKELERDFPEVRALEKEARKTTKEGSKEPDYMSDINSPEMTEEIRDALRLAGDRTFSQVKKSGSFLFKMKNTGEDIRKEFFDIYVFLLSDRTKAESAMQVLAGKNYKIRPESRQLSFEEIEAIEKTAYDFIRWSELIKEDDAPFPDEFKGLARLNERNQVALEYAAIADHLLSKFKIISYVGGDDGDGIDPDGDGRPDIYVYDEKTGIYSKDSSCLKNEIERISTGVQYKGSVTTATREIFFYVSYRDPQRVYPFNSGKNLIPVLNGVLRLNIGEGEHTLLPHSPENKFTYLIPVKYDPEAKHEPIDTILRQYVHPDDLWYLYQIPAQAILQGFCECDTLRTAYIIQGPARAGKSTYCDLLVEYFFSQKFVANENLQDLCGSSRFCTYNLPGKFLNLYDDLDDLGTIGSVSSFKNLIGSYNQSVEKKGVQRRTEKISCVHVFTCNRPPLLENKRIKTDSAWWDRWVYLRFLDKDFETDLKFKEKNFTPENMSGFLNQVLKTVVDILTDSSKFRKQGCEKVLSFWDITSDPISAFIHDCFYNTTGRAEKFNKESMLQAYKEYCQIMGIDDIHGITTTTKLSRLLIGEDFKPDGRGKNHENLYQARKGWNGFSGITDPTHREDKNGSIV